MRVRNMEKKKTYEEGYKDGYARGQRDLSGDIAILFVKKKLV